MTQRKQLITPLDALRETLPVRVRDRRAPNARVGAGLNGWLEWQLLDRCGRAVRGGQQHNLFLNQGLNNMANLSIANGAGSFQWAVVGTDSTAPDVTDVALGAEVGETQTKTSSWAWTRTGNGVYEGSCTYEFDFDEANGNLTEWGVGRGTSGGMTALYVRELFRDGVGDPTTVTKTSDYKLRLTYTLEITLTPVALTPASFTIDGIGVINGDYMWRGGPAAEETTYSQRDLVTFGGLASGATSFGGGGLLVSSTVDSGVYDDTNGPSSNNNGTPMPTTQTPSTFVAGTWERKHTATWGTAKGNVTIATIAAMGQQQTATNRRCGFVFIIDEGDRFTKDDLHTLTLTDAVTVTWGRA